MSVEPKNKVNTGSPAITRANAPRKKPLKDTSELIKILDQRMIGLKPAPEVVLPMIAQIIDEHGIRSKGVTRSGYANVFMEVAKIKNWPIRSINIPGYTLVRWDNYLLDTTSSRSCGKKLYNVMDESLPKDLVPFFPERIKHLTMPFVSDVKIRPITGKLRLINKMKKQAVMVASSGGDVFRVRFDTMDEAGKKYNINITFYTYVPQLDKEILVVNIIDLHNGGIERINDDEAMNFLKEQEIHGNDKFFQDYFSKIDKLETGSPYGYEYSDERGTWLWHYLPYASRRMPILINFGKKLGLQGLAAAADDCGLYSYKFEEDNFIKGKFFPYNFFLEEEGLTREQAGVWLSNYYIIDEKIFAEVGEVKKALIKELDIPRKELSEETLKARLLPYLSAKGINIDKDKFAVVKRDKKYYAAMSTLSLMRPHERTYSKFILPDGPFHKPDLDLNVAFNHLGITRVSYTRKIIGGENVDKELKRSRRDMNRIVNPYVPAFFVEGRVESPSHTFRNSKIVNTDWSTPSIKGAIGLNPFKAGKNLFSVGPLVEVGQITTISSYDQKKETRLTIDYGVLLGYRRMFGNSVLAGADATALFNTMNESAYPFSFNLKGEISYKNIFFDVIGRNYTEIKTKTTERISSLNNRIIKEDNFSMQVTPSVVLATGYRLSF